MIYVACNSDKPNRTCQFKEIKKIFSYGTPDSTWGRTYVHYVLLKEFARECIDSTTIVNIALHYIDTICIDKPVNVIMIFNSDKDFIPNEISQDVDAINKSCLVSMGINIKTKKPFEFLFYNDKGERLYWGNEWKPKGK